MRFPSDPRGRVGSTAPFLILALLLLLAPAAEAAVTLSEIRVDQPGGDNDEYFELAGNPGESLAGLTYIVIGDGAGGSGTIESVLDLTGNVINGSGFFLVAESSWTSAVGAAPDLTASINFENSDNVTHLLVSGFTGTNGDDLDTNDDCVLDVTPWTAIVDGVALVEEDNPAAGTECHYGVEAGTQVGPDGTFVPGHVRRCGPTSWVIGDFTFPTDDTPGLTNTCAVNPDVDNVIARPLLPEPAEAVTVTADATDDGSITSVDIFYQVNGGGYVSVAMSPAGGNSYTGTIPGQANGALVEFYVQATDNDTNTGTNPGDAPTTVYSYTVGPETITSIADIHANLGALAGTVVQIQGQVYCPGDYKQDGSVSAYVQDASGRGINIFGTDFSTGFADLNSTGNIVKISGTVTTFFTTVELVSYEVELVSSGNPALTPAVQASTAAAAGAGNEGTYIQATGVVSQIDAGVGGATNYTINDCSGAVVVRVDDDLLGVPVINVGDEITASGAGSSFSGQGQILVCSGAEITNNGFVGDLCPPNLLSASLTAATQVTLVFDESIDPVTGNNTANYSVFETATPGNTIAVSAASVQATDTEVILTLASAPSSGTSYTVQVQDVEDLAGNGISPAQSVSLFDPNAPEAIVITEVMQNPSALLDSDGEWFEVRNDGPAAVDMEGWTISDNDTDSHVIANGGPLVINPGEYKVFARNGTALAGEGVTVFYEYGTDITMSNGADEVILSNALAQEVDRVEYDGGTLWPDPNGHSMQWNGSGDNNDGANWTGAGAPAFGSGDRGTPGAVNDTSTPAPSFPEVTQLEANHPNPFNPQTTFRFSLERREHAKLAVYNLRGQLVRVLVDGELDAGLHTGFVWDGKDRSGRAVPSGTYFYRLTTESGFTDSRKMALLK